MTTLALKNVVNSKKQGDVGLGLAIAWFTMNGFHVSIPLTDSQDYDLVVDIDDRLCKVQVRTTYHRRDTGNYQVNLRVLGGNRSGTGKTKHFDPSRIDYLFVVTDAGDRYLIPARQIAAKSVISLCEKYAGYKVE